VPVLVKTTLEPGTLAPEESVAVPTIDPKKLCVNAGTTNRAVQIANPINGRSDSALTGFTRRFIVASQDSRVGTRLLEKRTRDSPDALTDATRMYRDMRVVAVFVTATKGQLAYLEDVTNLALGRCCGRRRTRESLKHT
jgi:hypothetical protein